MFNNIKTVIMIIGYWPYLFSVIEILETSVLVHLRWNFKNIASSIWQP